MNPFFCVLRIVRGLTIKSCRSTKAREPIRSSYATEPYSCRVSLCAGFFSARQTKYVAQGSGWSNIVQKIRIGNFLFWKPLWVLIGANIRPVDTLRSVLSKQAKLFALKFAKFGLKHHIWQFYAVNNFRKKSEFAHNQRLR